MAGKIQKQETNKTAEKTGKSKQVGSDFVCNIRDHLILSMVLRSFEIL